MKREEIKFVVHCGSASAAPNPEFTSYADAVERYNAERALPSYIRPGHKRLASITRVITSYEDVTPGREAAR